MNLRLVREEMHPAYTVGSLFIDGLRECWTLEDTVRPPGEKVPHATAIPFGKYDVVVDRSHRFGRDMPHVLDVPGFAGVRIHAGNTASDTEGCILVGEGRVGATLLRSRLAYNRLFEKMVAALKGGDKITLEIVRLEESV